MASEWRASFNPRELHKPAAPPRSAAPSTKSPTPTRRERSQSRAVSVLRAASSFINFDEIYWICSKHSCFIIVDIYLFIDTKLDTLNVNFLVPELVLTAFQGPVSSLYIYINFKKIASTIKERRKKTGAAYTHAHTDARMCSFVCLCVHACAHVLYFCVRTT